MRRVFRERHLVLACLAASTTLWAAPFDVVIANGRIVDGTGSPWYVAVTVGGPSGPIAAEAAPTALDVTEAALMAFMKKA
jgi:hypothetical protein